MPHENLWAAAATVRSAERWRSAAQHWGSAMTEALLDAAGLDAAAHPSGAILDVAAGSGDPALTIARHLGDGIVVAVDNSSVSLVLAKRKADEIGLGSKFQPVSADAHYLPFSDACFDRVTCRCGIMFFADVERALEEILRVLKPRGRAAFLAWGPFEQPFFESTFGTILRLVPGTSIPEAARAMFRFAVPGSLEEALRRAGFRNAHERALGLPRIWAGSPQELWQYVQEISALFEALLQSIPAAMRPQVDGAVCAELARFQTGSTLTTPAHIVLATAER
jgi:ubiquinone/menaquinone biosynthesis C-methylase UbiE